MGLRLVRDYVRNTRWPVALPPKVHAEKQLRPFMRHLRRLFVRKHYRDHHAASTRNGRFDFVGRKFGIKFPPWSRLALNRQTYQTLLM
jgi:hypothetical protein